MVGNSEILRSKALVELILDATDGVNGRKKLQKIVYLANSMGWNAFNDYRFHLYGPYSEDLLAEVQDLESAGFVEVEEVDYLDNPFYRHRITDDGRVLLEELQNEMDGSLIQRTRELAAELDEYSSDQLELMASLYYLKRKSPELTNEQLVTKLGKLKPQFSEELIRNALVIFEIMQRYTCNGAEQ